MHAYLHACNHTCVHTTMCLQAYMPAVTRVCSLQVATEAFITNLYEDAMFAVIHAKRVTLMPRDIQLALRLRGDNL
jgi:histone H3/H4